VKEGQLFTVDNVRSIRPAQGLHPRYLPFVLGRRATRKLEKGMPLAWNMVEGAASRARASGE